MLVAKTATNKSNPVGMAQQIACLMPSLRNFKEKYLILATDILSLWDNFVRKPF